MTHQISPRIILTYLCLVFSWNHVDGRVTPFSHQVLKFIIEDTDLDLSTECYASFALVSSVVLNTSARLPRQANWPHIMSSSIDSTPPDLRSLQMGNWADYDSCLRINTPFFTGKYCLYRQNFNFSHPSTDRLFSSLPKDYPDFFKLETVSGSVCIPSVCTDSEAQRILQKCKFVFICVNFPFLALFYFISLIP